MKTLLKVVLFLIFSMSAFAQKSDEKKAIDWVREKAIPFQTVEAGNGFGDLQGFGKIIGDKSIVALGESTHGTREIFRMKHRLIEYLVEKKGFTLFLLEAPFPTCQALNEYILHGKGDPEEALHNQGFWMWDTVEVLELVKWLRRHNEKPTTKRKVAVFGIDAKFEWLAIPETFKYLEKFAPEKSVNLKKDVAILFNLREFYEAYQKYNEAERIGIETKIENIIRFYDESQTDLIKKSGKTEWSLARQNAVVALQAMRFNREIFSDKISEMNPQSIILNYRIWHSAKSVRDFLAENDKEFLTETESFLKFFNGNFREVKSHFQKKLNDSERAKLADSAEKLKLRLTAQKENLIAKTSAPIWELRNKQATDLANWLKYLADTVKFGETEDVVRERAMADNVAWAIGQGGKGTKAVIWAHNFHTSRRPISIFEDDTLAAALARKFGDKLITFGFSFYEGSFRSESYPIPSIEKPVRRQTLELKAFKVSPSNGAIDQALNAVGQPRFFLDLRQAKNRQPQWLWQKHFMRHFGSGFNEVWESQSYEPLILPESFDVVIFLRETTASEVNPLTAKKYQN